MHIESIFVLIHYVVLRAFVQKSLQDYPHFICSVFGNTFSCFYKKKISLCVDMSSGPRTMDRYRYSLCSTCYLPFLGLLGLLKVIPSGNQSVLFVMSLYRSRVYYIIYCIAGKVGENVRELVKI